MRLGIMQPYFFPYLGYFSLIASVDEWVVFDVTQYTPKTWMNRNRILHPESGWQYITVALASASIAIKTAEATVLDPEKSKRTILGKLSHYRKDAPCYDEVVTLVERSFDRSPDDSLAALNISALTAVCDYLEIPFSFRVASRLSLEYPPNLGAGDWAPFICRELGASEYVNPVGGRHLFDAAKFRNMGIDLYFCEFEEFQYDTARFKFEPHLSVLDVMMWNSPESIRAAIQRHTRLTGPIAPGGP